MRHTTDFEKPIDWLAAKGFTGRFTAESDVYSPISVHDLKRLAREYKDNSQGKTLSACREEIVIALGFKHYAHYVDFMKRRDEFKGSGEKKYRNQSEE